MTDDSAAERSAIQKVYPNAARLLCLFHIIQAVSRWLKNKFSDIDGPGREECFALFTSLLYSSDTLEMKTK